jgi:hypothetical protein
MKYELALDGYVEKINNPKTREYFKEVHSSYVNGNYRSAVVMLWTVAVCDMLAKLESLRDIYNDTKAGKILAKIKAIQEDNPNSPAWEDELLKEIESNTFLFDVADSQNLKHLHQQRHLSAHPIIANNQELYSPSSSQVKTHILNTIDGLLAKPPILTNKVFDKFVEDIEANAATLINDGDLERFIDHRFLNSMPETVLSDIFKKLWGFVFFKDEERCNKNRLINFRALKVLFKKNTSLLLGIIDGNSDYYSNVIIKENVISNPLGAVQKSLDSRTKCCFDFLSTYVTVFNKLSIDTQTLIRSHCETHFVQFVLAWYLNDSIQAHAIQILEKINYGTVININLFNDMAAALIDHNLQTLLYDIAIKLYCSSSNFSTADNYFTYMIKPYFEEFSRKQLFDLLDGIEGNNQTYARWGAKADHSIIRDIINLEHGGYDEKKYSSFHENLPSVEGVAEE